MEKRKMIQGSTLPEVLGAYAESGSARFHMPGHKGLGMGGFERGGMAGVDVTELPFSDNLQHPSGPIRQTEGMLARLYGAEDALLSVNGSTGALMSMILALGPGEKLLFSRDCHKSVVAAAALRGLPSECILPEYSHALGMTGMVSPQSLSRRLEETGATAVLITSPNYCGLCADLPALAQAAHSHGAILMVDSAHGAHFPFSEALPPCPSGAADLFCVSLHKTLNAYTQTAALLLGDCRISVQRLRRAMRLTQTTSPSYPLMLSMHWAAYTAPRQDWTAQAALCRRLEERISAIKGLAVLPAHIGAGVAGRDPTRVVVDVSGRGLSGYAAERLLAEQEIYVEMADQRRLVLITSPEDKKEWYDRLLTALAALPLGNAQPPPQPRLDRLPGRRMSIREAVFSEAEPTPIAKAGGCVMAQSVGIYPPGVAWRLPGEILDVACIQELLHAQSQGAELFGADGGMVLTVRKEETAHEA